MNRSDFMAMVQSRGKYTTTADAQKAVKAVTEALIQAMTIKEDVSLLGFGTFTTALQKGKTGTVPGTDKKYTTQDKIIPKFKPGKQLKDMVAKGKQL